MRSDRVFWSFSSTMPRISSSFLLLSSRSSRRLPSTAARMPLSCCEVSSEKPCRRFSKRSSWLETDWSIAARRLSCASRPSRRFCVTSAPSAEIAPLSVCAGGCAGLRTSSTMTSTSSTITSASVSIGISSIWSISFPAYRTPRSFAMRCISSSVAAMTSAQRLRSSDRFAGTSTLDLYRS